MLSYGLLFNLFKESVKKVVRIWAENEIFPKPAMISTARVLKEMIDYVPPGIILPVNRVT